LWFRLELRLVRMFIELAGSVIGGEMREAEVSLQPPPAPAFGMTRDRTELEASGVPRPTIDFEFDAGDETPSRCEESSVGPPSKVV
jgi:hypothetical protein